MSDAVRETLRAVGGLVVLGSWLVISGSLVVGAQLMSVDEEWQGWGDVFLNPYIMLPYLAFSIAMAVAL